MSDSAIREAVLERLPEGRLVRADSIEHLRKKCGLMQFTNKQIRRAIESARYGHFQLALFRPRIDEVTRGWIVMKSIER